MYCSPCGWETALRCTLRCNDHLEDAWDRWLERDYNNRLQCFQEETAISSRASSCTSGSGAFFRTSPFYRWLWRIDFNFYILMNT